MRAGSAVPAAAELQMSFNLATILRESAKSRPDQALTCFADRSFSYAGVNETSRRAASTLLRPGLQPGQTVAVQLPNVPQFLFTSTRPSGTRR